MSAGDGASRSELRLRWLDAIAEYYDHTRFDYRAVWYNRENLAFHFGCYGDRIIGHAQALTHTNLILADIAGIGPGDRVLDAGCGLGGSSLWLAKHRSARVVGITPVMHQVTQARDIAARQSLSERVRFELADYTATPFESGSFDVVWALESLCHAVDKAEFYGEAARLLRPGGRLVVAEYVRSSRPIDAESEALMRQWLAGWAIPDLDTADEHRRAAADAGFTELRLADYTPLTRRSLRRLYELACLAYAIDGALYGLGLRSKTQHGNVVASRRQYQALRQGLWFYGLLSAVRR